MALEKLSQFALEDEYKKKTGITPEDIAGLRTWLETQPHLPSKYITDLDLILAFHACGCSTGVTKQVIDLNYTLRTLFTMLFKDRSFDDQIKKALDTVLITPLPIRTKEGYAVIYTHFLDFDPKSLVLRDALKLTLMVLDVFQYKEGTWPGIILLVDYEGLTLGHVPRYDVQSMQQFLYFMQEAVLVKLKGLHYINAPIFMDKLLMMMKPLMKKELMDVIGIHPPGDATVKTLVPIEALPKESGGKYKSYQECKDDVTALLQAAESYFKNENLKRVTESLRPGKPKTLSDIFGGVVGSFKKLDLDYLITPLPIRTKEGYAVIYTHFLDFDPKSLVLRDALKLTLMVLDVFQYKEGTWPGIILLVDYEGLTLGHVPRYDVQSMQQFLYFMQEAVLVKLKGLHYINAPIFMDKLLMMMKPLMKKELMDVIGIHPPGDATVKTLVPIEALPKESGGKYKSYQECKDDVTALLQAAESYFKTENLKRVTESLRPGKPKTLSDIFGGVVGSFKKLDLD